MIPTTALMILISTGSFGAPVPKIKADYEARLVRNETVKNYEDQGYLQLEIKNNTKLDYTFDTKKASLLPQLSRARWRTAMIR